MRSFYFHRMYRVVFFDNKVNFFCTGISAVCHINLYRWVRIIFNQFHNHIIFKIESWFQFCLQGFHWHSASCCTAESLSARTSCFITSVTDYLNLFKQLRRILNLINYQRGHRSEKTLPDHFAPAGGQRNHQVTHSFCYNLEQGVSV